MKITYLNIMSADKLDVKSLGIIKHDIEPLAQNILLFIWGDTF